MGPPMLEMVCLDLAGTTVADDGLVRAAFDAALDELGVPPGSPRRAEMTAEVERTMGTSKIDVFTALFGDPERAARANAAFEAAYAGLVAAGRLEPLPGAEATLDAARALGLAVVLTTGFSPATRRLVVDALGWSERVDLALSPADAGRGRPHPDLILHAVLACAVSDVAAVAVAGDTWADMAAGRRAGASVVAGVLTGSDDAGRLRAGGATVVLDGVGDLVPLLEARVPAARLRRSGGSARARRSGGGR